MLFVDGRCEPDMALACDSAGRVIKTFDVSPLRELLGREPNESETLNVCEPESGVVFNTRFIRLRGRALLPGMVNAHSHAFQRVIRGRTEYRAEERQDSFWTWREMMYSAAERLTPEDIYDASRMAFTEMLLGGITAVGEFHYLQRTPEGTEYDDPNLLSKQVVRAARDVGLRIALLRVAYARSGFNLPPNERQRRFIETDVETYLRHAETLRGELAKEAPAVDEPEALAALRGAWMGVAPHSVRAVPLEYLRAVHDFARARELPLHMHVAEQLRKSPPVSRRRAHARRAARGLRLLDSRFTGVHAIHISAEEIRSLRDARALVCACPTTERNLGDGIIPADALFREGSPSRSARTATRRSTSPKRHALLNITSGCKGSNATCSRPAPTREATNAGAGFRRSRRVSSSARRRTARAASGLLAANSRRGVPQTFSRSPSTTRQSPGLLRMTSSRRSSSRSRAPPSAKSRSAGGSSSKMGDTTRRTTRSNASRRSSGDFGVD